MSYNDPISIDAIVSFKNDATSKAKGLRLRYLREYASLERTEVTEIAGVTYGTYKDWEIGYFNIPRRRIDRIVNELNRRGFVCSAEWVELGEGNFPSWSEDKKIKAELDIFFKVNPNAISFEIFNRDMLPVYQVGDIVAGVKLFGNDINLAINKDCILELDNKTRLFRQLKKSDQQNGFNLICTNLESENPIIVGAKIISAAPIIWLRRRQEHQKKLQRS
jgi:transcriptional regulator with XRE-family HTH domain